MPGTAPAGDTAEVICGLKAAVTALECQYKMNMMERLAIQKEKEKDKKSGQAPMFLMVPVENARDGDITGFCDEKIRSKQKRHQDGAESVWSLDCDKKGGRGKHGGGGGWNDNTGPKLKAGVLSNRCGCIHRDGLQDDCPLQECQGQPECMTKPWATCPPARYYRSLFPEIYPS